MPIRRSKKTRSQSRSPENAAAGERLQKVLASAGIGSRRKCEELITEGRVEVDRKVVTELGTRVQPLTQEIRLDGQVVRQSRSVYFIVNKPSGVLSTNYDPEYRPRVVDLVKSNERLFTVGRLDQHSEGLILVTNDGELANRLMHPRYGAEKTYQVLVAGLIEQTTLDRMKKGVHLSEGVARVASVRVKKHSAHSTELEMVLQEGKNREIRRVFAAVGHKVLKLRRLQIGPIKLGGLSLGAHRPLSKDELEKLVEYAHSSRAKAKSKTPPRGAKPAATTKATVPDYEYEPLIDESDEALAADGYDDGMPLLVDDDLTHFEDRNIIKSEIAPRRPGAVIAFDDDDTAAVEEEKPAKPPPGRFSKKGRREAEERGKKKFARGGSGGARGEKKFSAKSGEKKFADKKFAPKKFPGKKFAKKKARRGGRG